MSEMQNNANTNIERIIAKIDNDFNPDNSDWIPRVGAWCIDAMSQLNVLETVKKKKKLVVKDRIAYSDCDIINDDILVYDSNNCEIKNINNQECPNCSPFTGESTSETSGSNIEVTNTLTLSSTGKNITPNYVFAETINDKYPNRYNIHHYVIGDTQIQNKNYVIVDNNKIELNFDTDYIYVVTESVKTECSSIFGCEMPVIPNNGLLLEAIAYYCVYKMLCRGYKHPVMNLAASQYGTNPYYMWIKLKDEAKRSVINNNFDDTKMFRSNFFINTFDPKN